MTPNRENIRKWVDALRSGEFQQARKVLRDPQGAGHCCLGVATELMLREQPDEGEWNEDGDFLWPNPEADLYDDEPPKLWAANELPEPVQGWLGIFDSCPLELIQLNDGEGCRPHSFAEIADLIEREYLS